MRKDLQERALSDFRGMLGKTIRVRVVDGFSGDDSVTVYCDPPALMRVVETPIEAIIWRWTDGWLDPVWDVDLVEPHPNLAGLRGFFVYATSYHEDGRVEPTTDWEPVPGESCAT